MRGEQLRVNRYPNLEIRLGAIEENAELICGWCRKAGIEVAGVIKGAGGDVEVARAMAAGGCRMLASSRLEQLRRCRDSGINLPLMMIRVPMLSEVSDMITVCEYSLNSEMKVIRAIDEAMIEARRTGALRAGAKHGVILMADLGDLREGYFDREELVEAALTIEEELEGVELAGVGTNLGCYGSVMPTEDKMRDLANIADEITGRIGRPLEIVSGGATSSLMGVFDGYMQGISMLRIGAAILVGSYEDLRTSYGRKEMDETRGDTFILAAEVIEVKLKPTHPIGVLGIDAFGNKPGYEDRGERRRMLLAVGRADYGDISDIIPVDEGIEVVGASGDHTIVDIEEAEREYRVGDIVKFHLRYSAILRLSASENVYREYI